MDKATYLHYFRQNREGILRAAARGLHPPVRGCPGWNVGALTAHVGGVYTFWLRWIEIRPNGPSEQARRELAEDRNRRLPGYSAWQASGFPADHMPDGIRGFARSTGDELEERLWALEPDEPVWTFIAKHQDAAFLYRRIALETAVHRWDAEEAHGIQEPIDARLAQDGIDERLITMLDSEDERDGNDPSLRSGKRFRFVDSEGNRIWEVAFGDSIQTEIRQTDNPVDVAIRGAASDLLLFIYGRLGVDEMVVEGDRRLAARWGDLGGRF